MRWPSLLATCSASFMYVRIIETVVDSKSLSLYLTLLLVCRSTRTRTSFPVKCTNVVQTWALAFHSTLLHMRCSPI
jgi:hypothetical protein